jgi:Ankyrin repeats (many copies)
MTPLAALQSNDLVEFERLLGEVEDIDAFDEHGWTLLNWAAGQGALPFVRLLVERGADVFKRGRDNRTPYLIALAAGRTATMSYLAAAERDHGGDVQRRSSRQGEQRPYCKAYSLAALRAYPGWLEPSNGPERPSDDEIVFVQQDYSVTRCGYANQDVVFADRSPAWRAFCEGILRFKVPTDLDLVPDNSDARP